MSLIRRLLYLRSQRRSCPHPPHRVRCIHGDEIILANYNRALCMDCRTRFPDLPEICFHSRRPHSSSTPWDSV